MNQFMDSKAVEETTEVGDASGHMLGLPGLIGVTHRYIVEEQGNSDAVIRRLSEDFAHIRLKDMWRPIRFLRQMEGNPPFKLGTEGFRPEVVDDLNPARHYMAFVAMGFWLPYPLAMAVLYLWEIAGYLRYRFQWSQEDILSGEIGVRHGNIVRRQGVTGLPELMAKDLGPAQSA